METSTFAAMERADVLPSLGSVYDHALAYCAQGWSLYPQIPGTKRPVFNHLPYKTDSDGNVIRNPNGYWERTTKPFWTRQPRRDELEKWFLGGAEANIALCCGFLSQFCVVEFDFPEDMDKFAARGGFPLRSNGLPDTPCVASRRGIHIYFQMPSRDGLLELDTDGIFGDIHLEVKGEGKVIVAPPSVHASGHVYRWLTPFDSNLAPLPAWFSECVFQHRCAEVARPVVPPRPPGRNGRYFAAALAGECEKVRSAGDGSRHSTVRDSAFKLAKKFVPSEISADELVETMAQAAREAGIGESDSKLRAYIRRSVRSACGGRI